MLMIVQEKHVLDSSILAWRKPAELTQLHEVVSFYWVIPHSVGHRSASKTNLNFTPFIYASF